MANETAGDVILATCVVEYLPMTAAAITKGNLLKYSTTGFLKTAAATKQEGPFAVALETKTSSGTNIKAVRNKGAYVYLVAGGTIHPGAWIMADSGTAGQVIEYAKTAIPANDTTGIIAARDDPKYIAGIYAAHANEGNGDVDASSAATIAANAASTDVIRCMLGGL